MTFSPRPLIELRDYWWEQGGAFLGIVGNASHAWGYHLGRNRIFGPGGRGNSDPSVRHPRDRAGLSNAAASIDLGRLENSIPRLRGFSSWLVTQCRDGEPGTDDVAEIIWTDTADTGWYYSGKHGRRVHRLPPDSTAARTHRGHTHISFFRDSERRSKVGLFAPFFANSNFEPAGRREGIVYERHTSSGRFTIRAGTTPRAWRPRADGTGWDVAQTWTARALDSGARYDHRLVRISGNVTPASLLGVSTGAFKGLYVSTAEVQVTPDPVPVLDAAAKVEEARLAGMRAGYDFARNNVRIEPGPPVIVWPTRP